VENGDEIPKGGTMLSEIEVQNRLDDVRHIAFYDSGADYLCGKRDAFKEVLGGEVDAVIIT
jgi:hypothetical protein